VRRHAPGYLTDFSRCNFPSIACRFLLGTWIGFGINRNMPKAVVARPALLPKARHARTQLAKLDALMIAFTWSGSHRHSWFLSVRSYLIATLPWKFIVLSRLLLPYSSSLFLPSEESTSETDEYSYPKLLADHCLADWTSSCTSESPWNFNRFWYTLIPSTWRESLETTKLLLGDE
jgi:hypothetical protein